MPQKLGQHFLKNASALHLIAKTLNPQDGETVIEIGPGHGELTEQLFTTNNESRILSIEKDEKLSNLLKEKFKDDNRITVIEGDALEQLPQIITQLLNPPVANYDIVGNIPYYITGHLFRVISELEHLPKRCVFTVQKEVAERICAEPPKMNRLAASVQYWAAPSIVKILPASDFNPKPKVASAIILLESKKTMGSSENYYRAVRALFAQPRKTIANNLAQATQQKKEIILEKLSELHIPPTLRPQDLNIETIAAIGTSFLEDEGHKQ